jgi:alcohol dehydrogenase class IV
MSFTHVTLAQRVHFGSGTAARELSDEVVRLGAHRVMLIAGPAVAGPAAEIARFIDVAVHHEDVAAHVPSERAAAARVVAKEQGIDLLVSVGGGSTTGLAKVIALTSGLPIVAVPTTYAGSEATNVWGITEAGVKTTGVDDRVLPVSVIYDAELTFSLPKEVTVASGLNALAHCIDSLWAPRTDPINQALASEGIAALRRGLPTVVKNPTSAEGRELLQYGAYLAAVAFASAGSGLHHKICHVLGGAFDAPHAQTHAAILPQVLAFNGPFAPEAEQRIRNAFDAATATQGLADLYDTVRAPRALRDVGFRESDIDRAAELILPSVPPTNPRPVGVDDLRRILRAAWAGTALAE